MEAIIWSTSLNEVKNWAHEWFYRGLCPDLFFLFRYNFNQKIFKTNRTLQGFLFLNQKIREETFKKRREVIEPKKPVKLFLDFLY